MTKHRPPTPKQLARRVRRRHGIELTPEQADEERRCAYASIRTGLRAKGYDVPDDDADLVDWLTARVGSRERLVELLGLRGW
jgi:hypothetical protein